MFYVKVFGNSCINYSFIKISKDYFHTCYCDDISQQGNYISFRLVLKQEVI